jgi:hypothetical protein
LLVADNMVKCNAYWREKSAAWKAQEVDPRDIRCRIANRLTRPVFQMVAGRQLFQHPSRLDRMYVMEKLLTYHREHKIAPHVTVGNLDQAAQQIPASCYKEEAKPLVAVYEKSRRSRRRQPQALGTLLVGVLARLGVEGIESQ